MSDIIIQTADGSFSAYHATPPGGAQNKPGIVLIQEIFGVNKVMRDLADGYAALGYSVLCPDLFWRQEPGIQITDQTEAEWKKAFQLFQGFDVDKGVEDLKATLAHLRALPGATGKAGSVGYCLGGKLAFLMATRSTVDCSVGYYGVGIEQLLDEVVRCPLLLHIAEKDSFVPPEAQAQIKARLANNPKVTIETYPGVDHAFARVGGQHYDPAAAKLANDRTAAFFKKHLA
jgi:carboxymethylenebutenolidase